MSRTNARRGNQTARRAIVCVVAMIAGSISVATPPASAADTRVPAGHVLTIRVPDAVGAKTVIGQLTVDNATSSGYVTAYGCDDGIPLDGDDRVARSDLNYEGAATGVWSNRLIAQADADGDVCFFAKTSVDMIVDLNGISFDTGITSFASRRFDTRTGASIRRGRVESDETLRIRVPEAVGGKTVVGQLTTDGARSMGYVTAFGCDDGLPTDGGDVSRSDVNFDDALGPARSNRLIVRADADGDICFHTSSSIHLVVDVNGVADDGLTSFANRRTDTRRNRASVAPAIGPGGVLRLAVPEAQGARTVIGQLTVDRARTGGFVTAYGCDDGLPTGPDGEVTRSDLNYSGDVAPIWSNRLVVQADADGDVCFHTSGAVDLIVDLNGVATDIGIFSFPNQRTDTRTGSRTPITTVPVDQSGSPVWPPFTPAPPSSDVAALTGLPAAPAVTHRPIVAVKIDNFRRARPHAGLEWADAVIEENVEGTTRFVALFQTHLPDSVGPIRSARTSDLDLLSAMNRPVFAYSGANSGVTEWIRSAADSGVLVDYSAMRSSCYSRAPSRPAPHDLVLDLPCAVSVAQGRDRPPGAAGALWAIDGSWAPSTALGPVPDDAFTVEMDGVAVGWRWDSAAGLYVRSQDGAVHLTESGAAITARNVVEVFSTHMPSPVDARSPHPITVGGGRAVIHRAGVRIEGTWSRPTGLDPFEFRDAATGGLVPLDVGTTFVELTRAS